MSDTSDGLGPEDIGKESNEAAEGVEPAEEATSLEAVEQEAPAGDDDDAEEAAEADEKPKGNFDVAPEPTPEDQIAELKDQLLRALAETENVRRRATRDREDATKYAMANFARDMLGVADNMRRAMDAVPDDDRGADDAIGALWQGVEMTERDLLAAMERHGIKSVEPLGEKFDHNLHQAMFEIPDADSEPGTILQVMQVGYVIGERLLRPAMVGVAKAPPAEESAGDNGNDEDEDGAAGGQVDTSA